MNYLRTTPHRYEVVFSKYRIYPFHSEAAAITFAKYWRADVYDTVEDKIIYMP